MKFNRYSNIFIHENAFENVVCEMASILSRPQSVKALASYSRLRKFEVLYKYISVISITSFGRVYMMAFRKVCYLILLHGMMNIMSVSCSSECSVCPEIVLQNLNVSWLHKLSDKNKYIRVDVNEHPIMPNNSFVRARKAQVSNHWDRVTHKCFSKQ